MSQKQIKALDRWGLFSELARHAHPSWYQDLLEWKTMDLRDLLYYYERK